MKLSFALGWNEIETTSLAGINLTNLPWGPQEK